MHSRRDESQWERIAIGDSYVSARCNCEDVKTVGFLTRLHNVTTFFSNRGVSYDGTFPVMGAYDFAKCHV